MGQSPLVRVLHALPACQAITQLHATEQAAPPTLSKPMAAVGRGSYPNLEVVAKSGAPAFSGHSFGRLRYHTLTTPMAGL